MNAAERAATRERFLTDDERSLLRKIGKIRRPKKDIVQLIKEDL